VIPGVAVYYSTAMPGPREAIPLIVETHDGRPTKVEGNPSYKGYGGGTDRFAQASILDLYDPDRLQISTGAQNARMSRGQVIDKLSTLHTRYNALSGKGLAILSSASSSPTRARLVAEMRKKMPEAVYAEYEPLGIAGAKGTRTLYHFDKAKRVLSFDYDFLNAGPGQLQHAHNWSRHRKVDAPEDAHKMNRVYVVESDFTLTGAMADHRLRASASQMTALAALLAAELLKLAHADAERIAQMETLGKSLKVDKKWIHECAVDLYEHREEALVACGDDAPEGLRTLVESINLILSSKSQTVTYVEEAVSADAGIREFADALDSGAIKTVLIVGGNPVYDAPADMNLADKLKKASEVIQYTYSANETSEHANTHIAANHYLESWSDGVTFDGYYVPVQPMILPLFEGFGETELFARLAGITDADEYKQVRTTFAETTGEWGDLAFQNWLATGVGPSIRKEVSSAKADASVLETLEKPVALSKNALEVRFKPSNQTYDGRFANNGWLLEMPDPMSKLTWDNAIFVSPRLGKELGVVPGAGFMNEAGLLRPQLADFNRGKQGSHMARLTVDGRTVEAPVSVMPGLADYTVVVNLGWGRKSAGRVGTDAGFDFYPLRTSKAMTYATGAKLELTGETYELANTQEHWSMEGRAIIREANADYFAEHPEFADEMGMEAHSPPIYGPDKDMPLSEKVVKQPRGQSMFKPPAFGDPPPNYKVWKGAEDKFPVPQQWGMSIDLNSCTGCNACVIACQAENNIPIVGKDQVLRGREMHWIRLDRYFSSGDGNTTDIPEDPQVSFMGMACQHCESAPCEYVCPFTATVHDEQGLNVMAYNRCAGTRYCANNCPYKVRRFNFFDWNKREIGEFYKGPLGTNKYKTEASELTRMQKNPDVTVRMRGVMEKCTYCVQRIEEAKINQLRKAGDSANVNVPDGVIRTACQQVCPTEAITFGDVSDENTEVYKQKMNPRDYSVLGYLNVRPRTTYLARLRNPNPKMPGLETKNPLSRIEYKGEYGDKAEGAHKETHTAEDAKH